MAIMKATTLIQEEFEKVGIRFRVSEDDDQSVVEAGYSIDNGSNVVAKFISNDDDNDVAMRIFSIINVKNTGKIPAILQALNELNNKYRFLKFVIDDDNDVNVEVDFPVGLSDDSVGRVAAEMFIRFMQIIDEAYPVLMRAMWQE